MQHMKISVIIPALNAQECLPSLLKRLAEQSVVPDEIIVIDSESKDATAKIARDAGVRLLSIPQGEFNHGRTRNIAARQANGEFLVFLTQDALPVDEYMLRNLVDPLEKDPEIAVGYGRQIAYDWARPMERFVRSFNYPKVSKIKGREDIKTLGVKAFFCSNACAVYRKDVFREFGGFREDTIMNEDMEFAYRAFLGGYKVSYAADACVWHSHDYTLFQQFKRYVDIGVFFFNNRELKEYAKNESEGLKYIIQASTFLYNNKEFGELVYLFLDTLVRFLGYRVGSCYRRLPENIIKKISMNKNYWD